MIAGCLLINHNYFIPMMMMWHEKIRLQVLTYMYGVCMFIIGSCAAGSLFFYLSDVYSIYAFNETP